MGGPTLRFPGMYVGLPICRGAADRHHNNDVNRDQGRYDKGLIKQCRWLLDAMELDGWPVN